MDTAPSIDAAQRLFLSCDVPLAAPTRFAFSAAQLDPSNGSLSGILDAFATTAKSGNLFGSKSAADQIKFFFQLFFDRTVSDTDDSFLFYAARLAKGLKLQNLAPNILNRAKGTDFAQLQNRLKTEARFTPPLDLPAQQTAYSGLVNAELKRSAELNQVPASTESLSTLSNGVYQQVLALQGLTKVIEGMGTAGPIIPGTLAPSILATTNKPASADFVTAMFSLVNLLANDTGSDLNIAAMVGVSGSVSLVTFNSVDNTVTVVSPVDESTTSAGIEVGSFTYILSNGGTTSTCTLNLDVFNGTTGIDMFNASIGSHLTAHLEDCAGSDVFTGISENDTQIVGTGHATLTCGSSIDLCPDPARVEIPIDRIDARIGTQKIMNYFATAEQISFGSV